MLLNIPENVNKIIIKSRKISLLNDNIAFSVGQYPQHNVFGS